MGKKKENKSFEEAYQRLDEILNLMNQGSCTLEESLDLYIEADALMKSCSKKLADAEQKIEELIKDRTDSVVLKDGVAATQPFKGIAKL